MEIMIYKKLKEKIDNYCEGKVHFETYIGNQKAKEMILKTFFDEKYIKKTIGLFKIVVLDDITIIEYRTENSLKNNIAIKGKNGSILKIEHIKPLEDHMCEQNIISIYDVNKCLISKTFIENLDLIVAIKMFDKVKEIDMYDKIYYDFYIKEDEVFRLVEMTSDGPKYFKKSDDEFLTVLNKASDLISRRYSEFNDKLDEMLGLEIVKEYKIKRKRQGQ